MARGDGLRPINITSEEARERGRKGGKASGEARRRKKLFKETFEILLEMPLKGGKSTDVESIKNFASMKGKNISVQDAVIISILQKAMKGDIRAAEYIRDTIGQKPTDNLNIEGEAVIIVNDLKE